MSRNKLWIGVILSILLLVFTVPGFASYYKYTQESGALFYVSTADEADALENHNEVRQIIDDLGNLLVHSKRNDSYPKDESTGGTLAIPNSALASFIVGTKGDLFYCSADNVWIKLSVGTDNQVLVVSTDVPNWETFTSDLLSDVASIAMLDEAETILGDWVNTAYPWADNEVADDITCSRYYLKTEINTQAKVEAIWDVALVNDADLDLYYLKTAIDTQGKVETIWGATLCTDAELATALSDYYLKVDIDTQTKIEAIWGVSLANDNELHNALNLGIANGLSLDGQELSLAINSSTSAGAVSSGAGQSLKVWKTDAGGVPGWRVDEGGVEASTFAYLSDTPASYVEQGNKYVRVKGSEDGLEFVALAGGGDVMGPAFSANHSIARFNGTNNKTIQDSLAFIDDAGSINIPIAQHYKINDVNLSAANVGAIPDALDEVQASNIDWGSAENQVDTDDVPEGANNKYFPGFDTLLADYGFTDNSTDWNTAYGWGDWSGEGFITNAVNDLIYYYLKTEIDTLSKVETIYTKDIIDSDELAALKFTDLDDTPANYTGNSLKFIRVNVGETALEFAVETDPTVDSDSEIKAILVDEVTKTGDFTAGRIAKINNTTGIIEQGTNTDTDVVDAVTKKHAANADTDLEADFEATFVKKTDNVNVLNDITSAGADIEDAVTKKHTQNTDTAAGGEWDFGTNSAGFTIQTAGGDGTTTINWTLGNYFKFTHGAMAETFTFNPAPTKPGHLTLIIIQDGVGGRDCIWPVPMKWLGAEPTWTDGGAGKGIVVAIVYDGTSYWSQGTPWEL